MISLRAVFIRLDVVSFPGDDICLLYYAEDRTIPVINFFLSNCCIFHPS